MSKNYLSNFKFVKWVKRGSFYQTYQAFNIVGKLMCIVKYITLNIKQNENSISKDDFLRQVKITQLFSKHNITSKFISSGIVDNKGYIVTEMWDRTITENDILTEEIIDKLKICVSGMYKLGYLHNDLHKQNIIVNVNQHGIVEDIALIDFDQTVTIEEAKLYIIPYLLPTSVMKKYMISPECLDLYRLNEIILEIS